MHITIIKKTYLYLFFVATITIVYCKVLAVVFSIGVMLDFYNRVMFDFYMRVMLDFFLGLPSTLNVNFSYTTFLWMNIPAHSYSPAVSIQSVSVRYSLVERFYAKYHSIWMPWV